MNALLSNPFKRGLLRGETQIGLWLSSTSSYMAEIAATSGYDWLLSMPRTPFRTFIISCRRLPPMPASRSFARSRATAA